MELVQFTGETHAEHSDRPTYQPVLISSQPKSDEPDAAFFVSALKQQMKKVDREYQPEEHGKIRLLARFGKIYMLPKGPAPEGQMTVPEFSLMSETSNLKHSFIPKTIQREVVEDFLRNHGFEVELDDGRETTETYKLNFIFKQNPEVYGDQIKPSVVLNGDLEVEELSWQACQWATIDVRRLQNKRRDIRLSLESVPRDFDNHPLLEKLQSPGTKLLVKGGKHGILVNREFVERIPFVRHKKSSLYTKKSLGSPSAGSSLAFDISIIIELLEIRELSKVNPFGEFLDVKCRNELVVKCLMPEASIHDPKNCDAFAREFYHFCNRMEQMLGDA